VVAPAWIDRRRTRVYCVECGEGINYQREVTVRGRTLCRACAGERYYAVVGRDASGGFGGSGPAE
jgi:formylmethanofuran dehydrogenase subunit E